jgi:trehalose-6-phosphate synthase
MAGPSSQYASRHGVARYYGHFANHPLWPSFHYFMGWSATAPADRLRPVNQRFAQVTPGNHRRCPHLGSHQLLRMPRTICGGSAQRPHRFLCSFPFRRSYVPGPARSRPLPGVLGADFLGFQTLMHVQHFFAVPNVSAARPIARDDDQYEGRVVTVRCIPSASISPQWKPGREALVAIRRPSITAYRGGPAGLHKDPSAAVGSGQLERHPSSGTVVFAGSGVGERVP